MATTISIEKSENNEIEAVSINGNDEQSPLMTIEHLTQNNHYIDLKWSINVINKELIANIIC